MLKEYRITLTETTTKDMVIMARSQKEASFTALHHHLGTSDQEENARIKTLTTHVSGSIHGEESALCKGSIHCVAVD